MVHSTNKLYFLFWHGINISPDPMLSICCLYVSVWILCAFGTLHMFLRCWNTHTGRELRCNGIRWRFAWQRNFVSFIFIQRKISKRNSVWRDTYLVRARDGGLEDETMKVDLAFYHFNIFHEFNSTLNHIILGFECVLSTLGLINQSGNQPPPALQPMRFVIFAICIFTGSS